MNTPKAEWIARFAEKLRALQPGMHPDDAKCHAIAESQHVEAADLEPEEAAEIYALEEPPGDAGSPGD